MLARHLSCRTLPLLFGMLSATALAQSYPVKPVRMVSPYPPGSSADVTSRLFAPKLAEAFGQQFIVDNRVGAAGNIGAEIVAHSAPNGYTLLTEPSAIAASASLYKNMSFSVERDFDPVAMLTTSSYLMVVNAQLPANTVKELIALAKARPGKLNFASTGYGGGIHLSTVMFMMGAGIEMVHVPYKGGLAAVADLFNGQIDMMFASTQTLLPQVKAGRARALGITSAARNAAAPDVPTIAESALPGFESSAWVALVAPAGVPRDIVTRLNAAIGKIGRLPDIVGHLAALGATSQDLAPAQVGTFIRDEIARWGKVVTAAGITAE